MKAQSRIISDILNKKTEVSSRKKDFKDDLNELILEISKSRPNFELLQNHALKIGIPFHADPIQFMSEILIFLSNRKSSTNNMKEKTL